VGAFLSGGMLALCARFEAADAMAVNGIDYVAFPLHNPAAAYSVPGVVRPSLKNSTGFAAAAVIREAEICHRIVREAQAKAGAGPRRMENK